MIRVRNLSLRAGTFALEELDFEVPEGAYAVLMGRTGSGKTTVLEALCGLRPLCRGTIELAGRDVTRLKPSERGIGYVPQDGALFSTLSVRDHLAYALRLRKRPRREIEARVGELAAELGIAALLDRKPPGLSGGEKQRVALGRALAARPAVLLLDEPLSALDDETREEVSSLLARVHQAENVTVLHVTHNRVDAERLADLVLLLRDGRIRSLEREVWRKSTAGGRRTADAEEVQPNSRSARGAWPGPGVRSKDP